MAEGKKRKKDLSKSAFDRMWETHIQTSGFTPSGNFKLPPTELEFIMSAPTEKLSPKQLYKRRKLREAFKDHSNQKSKPIKKAKGGLVKKSKKKPKKKSIDGIARKGKTKGKHR